MTKKSRRTQAHWLKSSATKKAAAEHDLVCAVRNCNQSFSDSSTIEVIQAHFDLFHPGEPKIRLNTVPKKR